jgi:hypothetical protein
MMRRGPAADIEVLCPGKRLGHLMRKPDLRRVLGNIEVNDLPSVAAEDDHGVELSIPKTSSGLA